MRVGFRPFSGLLSRRHLLRAAAALAWVIPGVAFVSMLGRLGSTLPRRRVIVPADPRDAISFAGGVIVSRGQDGTLRVFSARCTHLGCQIDRAVDGLLVCPCHGSRFRADGSPASGPAVAPLSELSFEIDRTTGSLIVHES